MNQGSGLLMIDGLIYSLFSFEWSLCIEITLNDMNMHKEGIQNNLFKYKIRVR